jgi:hypothetical protein
VSTRIWLILGTAAGALMVAGVFLSRPPHYPKQQQASVLQGVFLFVAGFGDPDEPLLKPEPRGDAVIRLRSLQTDDVFECASDADGEFRITAKPGKYRLEFIYNGGNFGGIVYPGQKGEAPDCNIYLDERPFGRYRGEAIEMLPGKTSEIRIECRDGGV